VVTPLPAAPGGERILEVFDVKLKETIYKLPFDKILTLKNVRNTINEADGYQPHIIAPEAGYRRLIEDGLSLLREPCERPGLGWGRLGQSSGLKPWDGCCIAHCAPA
jgi:hypothetical protein